MTESEFTERLNVIVSEANEKIVSLVHQAQEEAGLTWDTDKPLPWASDPNWERKADWVAELGGWIHDRVHGRNRTHRNSVTRKIRRALGYTIP